MIRLGKTNKPPRTGRHFLTNIIGVEAKTTVPPSSATRPPKTLAQVLKQCGNDLSRENVMKQVVALEDYQGSALLPGIKISTGPGNFRPIKHLRLLQFDGRTWQPIGEVLETAFSNAQK